MSLLINYKAYWSSVLVSERWECWTGHCPWRAKAAKMEPLCAFASLTLIAVLTASSPKQQNGMVMQICSRGLVLWILKAVDTSETCLADSCHTREEVNKSTIVILNRNIGLEEWINRGAPGFFDVVWYKGWLVKKSDSRTICIPSSVWGQPHCQSHLYDPGTQGCWHKILHQAQWIHIRATVERSPRKERQASQLP